MRADPLPDIIRASGDDAIVAYAIFCTEPGLTPGTRRVYAAHARRFLRWAGRRGRTLETIAAADLEAYRAELAAETLPRVASRHLSPIRRLLGALARASDPAGRPHRRGTIAAPGGREPAPSLAELKEAVRELGDPDEDSRFFQAGLVMLAPLAIGTLNPATIAEFTGVPGPRVREFSARLLTARTWRLDGTIEVAHAYAGATSLGELDLMEVYFDVCSAAGGQTRRHDVP